MYINESIEEIEAIKCTSVAVFEMQKSIWMKINFVITFLIIFATFAMSAIAVKTLKFRNVFSNGTRFLLLITLLNANVNQASFFEIRLRHLYRVLIYSNDPCTIMFHSLDCVYDQSLLAFTTNLSTLLVCALTIDRFLADFAIFSYSRNSKKIAYFLVITSIVLTCMVYFITYGGIPLAGYVLTCSYPPRMAANAYRKMNIASFVFIMLNCLLMIINFLANLIKDKRIRKSVYDAKIRYTSYENLITTKAICSISSAQFIFLSLKAGAVTILQLYEMEMSEATFHTSILYFNGVLYANLSIPILIYRETMKCIKQRRKSIGKLRSESLHLDSHILSLRKAWEER